MSTDDLAEQYGAELDADWEAVVSVELTIGAVLDTVFAKAGAVHSGDTSCVDPQFVIAEITSHDERTGNYCRLVELEFREEDEPDVTWHDWTVEICLNGTFIVGHWRVQIGGGPADWDWSAAEAEMAFRLGSVLVGRRVRMGPLVEPSAFPPATPKIHH